MTEDAAQNDQDPWVQILIDGYTDDEATEIRSLIQGWGIATYDSAAHCIVDHAHRHGFKNDYLKYLRKANQFKKRGATKVILRDGATRWNRSGEFIIERDGKIVSYGINIK